MVRVVLPTHLRVLARTDREVALEISAPVTIRAVLDALEATYPPLQGTLRDHVTHKRRPLVRFFACQDDVSLSDPDDLLPDTIARGVEPFYIIGAIAGGTGGRPIKHAGTASPGDRLPLRTPAPSN